jgi:hypothetical protein
VNKTWNCPAERISDQWTTTNRSTLWKTHDPIRFARTTNSNPIQSNLIVAIQCSRPRIRNQKTLKVNLILISNTLNLVPVHDIEMRPFVCTTNPSNLTVLSISFRHSAVAQNYQTSQYQYSWIYDYMFPLNTIQYNIIQYSWVSQIHDGQDAFPALRPRTDVIDWWSIGDWLVINWWSPTRSISSPRGLPSISFHVFLLNF